MNEPPGEHRGVQRGELVIAGGDDLPEPFPENLRVILQPLGRAGENDALLADGLLDIGIDGLGVELRLDPGEELALLLRDAEPLECPLHVFRHLVPRAGRPLAVREVIADFVKVDRLEVPAGPMRGQRASQEGIERLQAEIANPVRLALHVDDVIDGVARQPVAGVEFVALRVNEIPDAAVDIDGFSRHIQLEWAAVKPPPVPPVRL